MRSNEACVLKVPRFKHDTFCKQAFIVCGPLAWNCLPKENRLCDDIEAFKQSLKTHLFAKFVKLLRVYYPYRHVKIPQCRYMEHELKYIKCYDQKHIAPWAICYNPPLVRNKPLGGPAYCETHLLAALCWLLLFNNLHHYIDGGQCST